MDVFGIGTGIVDTPHFRKRGASFGKQNSAPTPLVTDETSES
jgi:hypothetical protein